MKSSEKYITEYPNHWRVRIRTSEDRIVKCFAFLKWGGKERAFILALRWRNATLKKYGLSDRLKFITSPDFFAHYSKINPIIGVYETQTNGNYNWCARVQIDGAEVKRHFAINKYGYEKAFKKACRIRFKSSGKLIVINEDLMPCVPTVPYKIQK